MRSSDNCLLATRGIDEVYNLAADMGGIGYITAYLADIARNNILINAHMLEAASMNGVKRFLFSSSACVYAQYKQKTADVTPLRKKMRIPPIPSRDTAGKSFLPKNSAATTTKTTSFETRIVRFHNVYGPLGTYEGGKEKAPAAISRKVALARDGGEIEIWGDGDQTRSFMYVDDCVEGLIRLMASDHRDALNLGTDRIVTINGLVDMICRDCRQAADEAARPDEPQGVRGRNSDNTPAAPGAWVGNPDHPRGRPGSHLQVD